MQIDGVGAARAREGPAVPGAASGSGSGSRSRTPPRPPRRADDAARSPGPAEIATTRTRASAMSGRECSAVLAAAVLAGYLVLTCSGGNSIGNGENHLAFYSVPRTLSIACGASKLPSLCDKIYLVPPTDDQISFISNVSIVTNTIVVNRPVFRPE